MVSKVGVLTWNRIWSNWRFGGTQQRGLLMAAGSYGRYDIVRTYSLNTANKTVKNLSALSYTEKVNASVSVAQGLGLAPQLLI